MNVAFVDSAIEIPVSLMPEWQSWVTLHAQNAQEAFRVSELPPGLQILVLQHGYHPTVPLIWKSIEFRFDTVLITLQHMG